jgi:anthranilate synthase component 1
VRARDGEVTIRPIAGTRPRGKSASEDAANKASLLADPKERAEHLMLLDLGRNDVGRVAAAGTVQVTDSYAVEFYSHVMHIVSNVVGGLAMARMRSTRCSRVSRRAPSAARPRSAPARSSPSWNQKRAVPYAGGVGYFAPDGNMDSCIVLRTAVLKDGIMHAQAGAGIVADSTPNMSSANARQRRAR